MAGRCHLGKWCYFRRHNLFGGDVGNLFFGGRKNTQTHETFPIKTPHLIMEIKSFDCLGEVHIISRGSWLGTVDPDPPHLANKKKPYGIHIYATPILVVCIYINICNICSISYVAFSLQLANGGQTFSIRWALFQSHKKNSTMVMQNSDSDPQVGTAWWLSPRSPRKCRMTLGTPAPSAHGGSWWSNIHRNTCISWQHGNSSHFHFTSSWILVAVFQGAKSMEDPLNVFWGFTFLKSTHQIMVEHD